MSGKVKCYIEQWPISLNQKIVFTTLVKNLPIWSVKITKCKKYDTKDTKDTFWF